MRKSTTSSSGSEAFVFVNAILEERGVGQAELEEHRRELEHLRSRLVELVLADANELGPVAEGWSD
jgi:hypothetical protein